jgi:small subunit ribosomal protein S3
VGQKVHPYGFRLGVTKTWRSRWFAKADYAKLLKEDLDLKDSLRDRLKAAGVSSVEVDRPGNKPLSICEPNRKRRVRLAAPRP